MCNPVLSTHSETWWWVGRHHTPASLADLISSGALWLGSGRRLLSHICLGCRRSTATAGACCCMHACLLAWRGLMLCMLPGCSMCLCLSGTYLHTLTSSTALPALCPSTHCGLFVNNLHQLAGLRGASALCRSIRICMSSMSHTLLCHTYALLCTAFLPRLLCADSQGCACVCMCLVCTLSGPNACCPRVTGVRSETSQCIRDLALVCSCNLQMLWAAAGSLTGKGCTLVVVPGTKKGGTIA